MSSARLDHLRIKQLRFVGLLASLGSLAATAEHLSIAASSARGGMLKKSGILTSNSFAGRAEAALTGQRRALLPMSDLLGESGRHARVDSRRRGSFGTPSARFHTRPR